MLTLTFKGMRARKLRLLLSAVSVVLGVAFVTASFTLGDTIRSSFDDHIAEANAGVDAVVMPVADKPFSPDGVPTSLVDAVSEADGVLAAAGTTSGFAQLRAPDTGASAMSGSGMAIGWIEDDVLNPLTLVEGEAPTGRDEVVVDRTTADDIGVGLGETARLITLGPARDVTVVGFAELGEGGISVLGIEPRTAAEAFGFDRQVSEIRVRGAEGLTEREVADLVEAVIPAATVDGAVVRTGTEVTDANVDQIAEQTGVITTFLLVFAGITLFVGGFLIVNTFAMLTAQRTRELAVLRALGASRGQLLRSVVTESVVVGVVASVAGLAVGMGFASGLVALLGRLGLGMPEASLALEPRTVVLALVLGPLVTAVASLLPARRASAVQPVEAMREAALPRVRRRRRAVLGAVTTLVAVAASLAGQLSESTPLVATGAVMLILSAIVWGPLVIGPVTRVLAWPLVRLGGRPTRLAEGNVLRTPHRSASTAAALVVGLALVSGTSVIGASMSGMAEDAIEGTIEADVVLWSTAGLPFGAATAEEVREQPGVASVASVKFSEGSVAVADGAASDAVQLSAMDPSTLDDVIELGMVEGSTAGLADGRVLVSDGEDLSVGDDLTVTVEGAAPLELTVGGVYEGTPALGSYLLTTADLATLAPQASDIAAYVLASPGTTADDLAASLDEYLVEAFPLVSADTMDEFAAANRSFVDQAVTMVTALLGLSLLVALLGVANTLTLSVIERTREIGMLRSIGMSRRQLRSMVRVEAVLMAAYGAVLGALIGLGLGSGVASVLLDGVDVPVVVPGGRLVLLASVAVVAAVGAAALPARRAARLDVLKAVSTA